MVAPLLGVLADRQGVAPVMLVIEAFLVAAVLLSLLLPQAPRSLAPQPEVSRPEEAHVAPVPGT
jgi:hypothetical protein